MVLGWKLGGCRSLSCNVLGDSVADYPGGRDALGLGDVDHRVVISRRKRDRDPCGRALWLILVQGVRLHGLHHCASR